MNDTALLPIARKANIVVQELPNELLVYDLSEHKAFCLNETSRQVWEICDGRLTFGEARAVLHQRLGSRVDNEFIWLALGELNKLGLLEESSVVKSPIPSISRRTLMESALKVSLALPLVSVIVAPKPIQARSINCLPSGFNCSSQGLACCSGICNSQNFCDCLADGQPCDTLSPGDVCCAGFCNSGGSCGCRTDGLPCLTSAECCGGFCNTGERFCGCRADGLACNPQRNHDVCCTNFCNSGGSCGCRVVTDTCGVNRDCCSNNCVNGNCAA